MRETFGGLFSAVPVFTERSETVWRVRLDPGMLSNYVLG